MKLTFGVTIIVVSIVWGPACVLAQEVQDTMPVPVPHSAANPSGHPGLLSPEHDSALPSRRVPSLTPPRSDGDHPILPDEAWPKPPPSDKPAQPSVKSGTEKNMTDETLLEPAVIDTPLKGISGVAPAESSPQ